MTKKTITFLNQLNLKFYKNIASAFSQSRQRPWEGWKNSLPYLTDLVANNSSSPERSASLSIMDVGGGNGRFFQFILSELTGMKLRVPDNLAHVIRYVHVDSNRDLSQEAERSIQKTVEYLRMRIDLTFINQDLITWLLQPDLVTTSDWLSPFKKNTIDCIALFGILHHVPSYELRLRLLQRLSTVLRPGGFIFISTWQFDHSASLMQRAFSIKQPPSPTIIPLDILEDFEQNDYILDWKKGKHAYRYCHLTAAGEMNHLLQQCPNLQQIEQYSGQAGGDAANEYYILYKQP